MNTIKHASLENGEKLISYNGKNFAVLSVAGSAEAAEDRFTLSLKAAFLSELIIEADRIIKEDGTGIDEEISGKATEGIEEIKSAKKQLAEQC